MKKIKSKIISKKEFEKRRLKWQNQLYLNQKVKKLSKKLYIEADKNNFCYLYNWNGLPIMQTPDDLLTKQELLFKSKPNVVIETGVCWGGSILFYNSLSKEIPIKKIIGIDTYIPKKLKNFLKKKCGSKLELIRGDSISPTIVKKIEKIIKKYKGCFVHLDSLHTTEHVYNELNIYSKCLTKKDYLVVGDTIVNEIPNQLHRPRIWNKKNNPMIGLNKFLKLNKNFKYDIEINKKQLLTNNPRGYIRKK